MICSQPGTQTDGWMKGSVRKVHVTSQLKIGNIMCKHINDTYVSTKLYPHLRYKLYKTVFEPLLWCGRNWHEVYLQAELIHHLLSQILDLHLIGVFCFLRIENVDAVKSDIEVWALINCFWKMACLKSTESWFFSQRYFCNLSWCRGTLWIFYLY